MRLDEIAVASEAIEKGEWRDAVGLPGVQFFVRGLSTIDFRRLNAKLLADARVKAGEALDPAVSDTMVTRLLHETVLKGWRGITVAAPDGSGEVDAPFDPDITAKALSYPKFRDAVFATARVLDEQTLAERAAAAKN